MAYQPIKVNKARQIKSRAMFKPFIDWLFKIAVEPKTRCFGFQRLVGFHGLHSHLYNTSLTTK